MATSDLSGALRVQSGFCEAMGSPFNAALLLAMADDQEAGGPVAELTSPWAESSPRELFDAAVPLRLVNAFNHLARSGEAPNLAAVWPKPGETPDPGAAWAVARAGIAGHREHLAAFMGHEPQTNEVRRSACLLPGFLSVAAETGLPLRCFEVGASAGLNQFWDRFHYDLGESTWGDPASPVRLATEWTGPPPPLGPAQVVERAACDRRPTDLNDPVQRRRLLACIWPDQFERHARSEAAIALALESGVRVETADALDWTRACVAPRAGTATVLYHSSFWQYLPGETQQALAETIHAIGVAATARAPFAWLRKEPPPDDLATDQLRLTVWPGGEDRLLAEVHPHGAWVRWREGRARPETFPR